jgi:hypothetical protein
LEIHPVASAYLPLGSPMTTITTGTLSDSALDAQAELHMTWAGGAEARLRTRRTS